RAIHEGSAFGGERRLRSSQLRQEGRENGPGSGRQTQPDAQRRCTGGSRAARGLEGCSVPLGRQERAAGAGQERHREAGIVTSKEVVWSGGREAVTRYPC